jgi:hypothetical protein
MGLSDLTLGWYEDTRGIDVSDSGKTALQHYLTSLGALPGATKPKAAVIRGWTFAPAAVIQNTGQLQDAIRTAVSSLVES